jgi:glycerophosphoryl diester phosphodiesterase
MLQRFVDLLMNLKSYPPVKATPQRIVAHRGAWSSEVTENSLAAFTEAQKMGAWGIELDVHFTKDSVPVIHHDPTLNRVLKLNLEIADSTWAELQKQTQELISLERVLSLKPIHFMIEIKTRLSSRERAALGHVLTGLTPTVDYYLLALHPDLIFDSPQTPLAAWVLVGEYNLPRYTQLAIERGLAGVAGHYLLLHNGLVKTLHQAGKKAGVGFVPNQNLLQRELGRGIDWIFTNTLSALTSPQT